MAFNIHQILSFVNHFFSANRRGHGIHSPFAYQLCENVFYNTHHFYEFETLNAIRLQLQNNKDTIEVEDFGAGSKTFKGNYRKINEIALKGISSRKQSEIIYKLINFLDCKTCVELGTSLGLNSLYIAKVNTRVNLISVEGSKHLSEFAYHLASKNKVNNIQFIHSTFEEALPSIIEKNTTVDFLYVDGNHTYEATLRYFNLFVSKKHNGSVFIFDDIYWSKGMTKAWEEIKQHPSVTLSIDLFYFGLVFFKPEIKEKISLRLFI